MWNIDPSRLGKRARPGRDSSAAARDGRPGAGRPGWPSRRCCWFSTTQALALPPGILLALLLFRTDVWGRGLLAGDPGYRGVCPAALARDGLAGSARQRRADAGHRRAARPGRPDRCGGHPRAGGLPWVVFLAGVGFRTVEPELEESAELDMPAGRVWCIVTLRRAVGAIAAAAVAVAVLTAGDMTVTDLLQVRTYAEEAYVQFTLGHGPADAAVVSVPPLSCWAGRSCWSPVRSCVPTLPRLASAFAPARTVEAGRWRVPLGARCCSWSAT